jgi:hypothetical protein
MSKDTPVEGQESWGDQVADTEESAKRKGNSSEPKASPSPVASSSPAVEATGESGAAKKRTTAEE